MDLFQAINQEKNELLFSARLAILHGMRTIWDKCQASGRTPQEPDFIAGLVLETMPQLSISWNHIFSHYRIKLSIASVFCHQSPKVKFSEISKSSCELGDILFVHVHTDLQGSKFRNALLYQAKVTHNQPYSLHSNELDQLSLYYSWPQFTYTSSGKLNGKERNVLPKMPHTGAQYMLIDDRPPHDPQSGLVGIPGTYPIGSCMASKKLYDHNMLELELFDFLSLRSGRAFEDFDSTMDDWSAIVWDLLDVGLTKAFNRKRSGFSKRKRGWASDTRIYDGLSYMYKSGSGVTSTAEKLLDFSQVSDLYINQGEIPPDYPKENEQFYDENPGTSVIIIETRHSIEE